MELVQVGRRDLDNPPAMVPVMGRRKNAKAQHRLSSDTWFRLTPGKGQAQVQAQAQGEDHTRKFANIHMHIDTYCLQGIHTMHALVCFIVHEYMHAYIPTFTTCSNTGVGSHQGHDSPIESAVGLGGGHNRRHDHPLTDEEDDDLVCAAEHTVYVTFSKVLLQKTLRSQPFVSHPHTPSCVYALDDGLESRDGCRVACRSSNCLRTLRGWWHTHTTHMPLHMQECPPHIRQHLSHTDIDKHTHTHTNTRLCTHTHPHAHTYARTYTHAQGGDDEANKKRRLVVRAFFEKGFGFVGLGTTAAVARSSFVCACARICVGVPGDKLHCLL